MTGKNGNSIFLPAAGQRINTSVGFGGSYWSSSVYEKVPGSARYLGINVVYYFVFRGEFGRCFGLSIRPVTE